MKTALITLLMLAGLAMADDSFRITRKQDIVTRPPAEFVRYYAVNVWPIYPNYKGFAKVSRIWPGSESPLAEAAKACESLMCED